MTPPPAMTTVEATRVLAEIEASRGYGMNEPDTHLVAAHGAGRAWKWQAAERHLEAAYRSLGAEPPNATGYDWHCGRHPIQVEAAKIEEL